MTFKEWLDEYGDGRYKVTEYDLKEAWNAAINDSAEEIERLQSQVSDLSKQISEYDSALKCMSEPPYHEGSDPEVKLISEFAGRARRRIAENTVDNLKSQIPRWVPVSDRLPVKDGLYLAFHPDWNMEIIEQYQGRLGCIGLVADKPTHWMPLPDAP